jgi:hypothetical protein
MQRLRGTQEYGVNTQPDPDSSKLRSHSSPELLPGEGPALWSAALHCSK